MDFELTSDQVDLKELESLMPEPKPKPRPSGPERPMVDIPILPQGIDLTDSDIEVRVQRFAGVALDARDVAFDGRIREGYMHPSPFSAVVAETPFTGAVLMDLRGQEPSAGLWLFAIYWNDLVAAGLGVVWIVGRILYVRGYVAAAEKRELGFGIQTLATAVLVLGALGRLVYLLIKFGPA